jgi:dipeptidyl aminopeptidase/acylaminoacyl peptidase
MAKRRFRPEDGYRLRTAGDPDLSPDGRRVAFTHSAVDEEADRLGSSIWVAALDGSAEPRRFTEGPADTSPRWSPDGRWLAYLSVTDDKPEHAHVRLAPLDGGAPMRLGDLPGPVTQLTWSPDSQRLAVACRVGVPDREKLSARERNAPRVPRGLSARLDGVGWYEGRLHLFLIGIEDGSVTQLTRGDYDHLDASFSPDGATVVFVSDRHPRRDDRQLRSDVWVAPVTGGRARRLTNGNGRTGAPVFSPDGTMVCFAGVETDVWDADNQAFVVPSDGSGPPQRVAPEIDRPLLLYRRFPSPLAWTGERELTMLIADHGGLSLHQARLGEAGGRQVVGGDIQVDGFSARVGRPEVVFTASWPDRPSELYATTHDGREPVRVTHLNDALVSEVELSPVKRQTITRPDGTEVEYFTIAPPGRAERRLPLHLDIHGGPHAAWPSGYFLTLHQAIAAAGYLVLLPNPRGSSGYGQQFTAACTGDWGGADYEDILACCEDLVERGVADRRRMFVSGGSYGGFMTSWIVGHTDRFQAATAVAAVVDETSMALTTDLPDFSLFNMGGTPWQQADEYKTRSPLHYLPNVTTPVLVIHWEGDLRVPIGQGEELYAGLRSLGKKAEFVRYPGGFHIARTPSQAVDWTKRTIAWNQQHDPRRRSGRSSSTGGSRR